MLAPSNTRTMTDNLLALVDWLNAKGVTHVAMESMQKLPNPRPEIGGRSPVTLCSLPYA